MDYTVATPSQFGAILRGSRKQRGLSQKELAQKVAMGQKAVSAIELNPGSTTFDRLFRLLSALDLELVVREKKADGSGSLEW